MSNESLSPTTVGFPVGLMRAFVAGQWAMGPEQISHLVREAADEIERLAELAKHWEALALNYWDRIEHAQNALRKSIDD